MENQKKKADYIKPAKNHLLWLLKQNVHDSTNGLRIMFKESKTVQKIYPLYIIGTIILGLISGFTPLDYIVCAIFLVLDFVVETLNSAIEELGDRITRSRDEGIRRAKDISSGAVYLMHLLLIVVILGFFVGRLAGQYIELSWWPVRFY